MEYLIIGSGRVGISLALALQLSMPHFRILARSGVSRARAVAHGIGEDCIISHLPEVLNNTLVAICTPDEAIPQVADDLQVRIGSGVIVLHTSGVLGAEALMGCARSGAAVCAAHPYQTFFAPRGEFGERYMWGIEAPNGAVSAVEEFIELVGGNHFYLPPFGPEGKALYHASAVFCSNYMNTIISLGKSAARRAGIPPEQFLPPIMRQTLKNNIEMLGSRESPMTGPIAREDLGAIARHVSALGAADAHMRNAYIYLALAALEDSIRGKFVTQDFYEKAKQILIDGLK